MTTVVEERDVYVSAFERLEKERAGEASWLAALRKGAIARFTESGFPTTKLEAWKYTSVAPLARIPFRLASGSDDDGAAAGAALERLKLAGFRGPQVVFVNGRFAPAASSFGPRGALPAGVEVASLRDVLPRDPRRVEPHLGRILGDRGHAFSDLNAAFLDDGAFVSIAPGAVVAEPIHLIFLSRTAAGAPTVSYPRTLLVAGRGSQATVVESYGSADGDVCFADAVTEIAVEDGALLDHYTVQRQGADAFHVATLAVRQGRGCRFSNHSITLGGSFSRSDIHAVLAGEGGECVLNGLFLAGGRQHMDVHTWIDHAQPHCNSRELYKGILDGRARGVFHGTILVEKDAQKTDAHQTNKNLLLSRDALVNSTPALQIYADDVKCKHGSTTGQLDPAALFYLRSRGLGEEAARSLLTYAFASDVVHRIQVEPIRAGLEAYLQSRLPAVREVQEAVV